MKVHRISTTDKDMCVYILLNTAVWGLKKHLSNLTYKTYFMIQWHIQENTDSLNKGNLI